MIGVFSICVIWLSLLIRILVSLLLWVVNLFCWVKGLGVLLSIVLCSFLKCMFRFCLMVEILVRECWLLCLCCCIFCLFGLCCCMWIIMFYMIILFKVWVFLWKLFEGFMFWKKFGNVLRFVWFWLNWLLFDYWNLFVLFIVIFFLWNILF